MPVYYGTNSNDVLVTGPDDDIVYLLDGDDAALGELGNDELHGNAGNDQLSGGEGRNTLYGEEGNDTLAGGHGDSYAFVYGGDGNDLLSAATSGGELWGGAGDDILTGASVAMLLDGGDGNDSLTGGDGWDTLNGGGGIDTMTGGQGGDTYYVDNALDVITGETFATEEWERDTLVLADDSLVGSAWTTLPTHFEVLDASMLTADATLTGNAGEDVTRHRITIEGGAGDDSIIGTSAEDHLDGNGGNDTLVGGDGNDTYVLDSRDDVIAPEAAWTLTNPNPGAIDRVLLTGSAFDTTTVPGYAYTLPDNIEVLLANDATGNLHIVGNDNYWSTIADNDGNGTIEGGGGFDLIQGEGGDDVMDAGAGGFLMLGYTGDDTYIIRRENTLIDDPSVSSFVLPLYNEVYDHGNDAQDTLDFIGVASGDVQFGKRSDDLLVLTQEGHLVTQVTNYFRAESRVEHMLFNGLADAALDQRLADLVALHDSDPTSSPDGHDDLDGSESDDTIDGGAGSDSLQGKGGNDLLLGGSGDDYIDGDDGNDTLDGGDGASTDMLGGGLGGDTYLYGRGDGVDVICDWDATNAGTDVLQFTDLTPGEVSLARYDVHVPLMAAGINGLRISVIGTTDRVDILGQFPGPDQTTGEIGNQAFYRIEEIRFADGTVWDAWDIEAASQGNLATIGNDTLTGTSTDDRGGPANDPSNPNHAIDGLAGNDDIRTLGGADMAWGGDGDDTVLGGNGDDMLFGGAGNDSVNGGNDNDSLFGGAGDDEVRGGGGNDLLIGVEIAMPPAAAFSGIGGLDSLYGGAGDDIYVVVDDTTGVHEGLGNGIDTVWVTTASYTLTANVENLYTADLESLPTDVGQYIAMAQAPVAASLTGNALANTLVGNALDNSVNGAGGDDTVYGQDGNDTLEGANGNDSLLGGRGADSLTGGAHNDTLDGGLGNDTVLGGIGDDSLWGDEGNDSMAGGDGNDTLEGTAGWDTLLGGFGNDSLLGGHGSDTLRGGDGDDTLFGGVDNDRLVGEAGTDVFQFLNPFGGGGIDTIVDFAGDVIQIGAGLTDLVYTGALDAANFCIGSTAADADDRFVYDATNGRLYYDADGSGATAQVQFATLTGAPVLAASDIVLA